MRKTILFLTYFLFLSLHSEGAKKPSRCSAQLMAFASGIEWMPDTVSPEFSLPLIVMLNSAPNTWVEFGAPKGESVFQRGYDCGDLGTPGIKGAYLVDGAKLAMKFMAGKLEPRPNDFSILASYGVSEKYLRGMNAEFSVPLAVRGKLNGKFTKTNASLDALNPANHSVELPGDIVKPENVDAMGLFSLAAEDPKSRFLWASNYLYFVDQMQAKGFRFLEGSDGEKIHKTMKAIWDDRQFLYGGTNRWQTIPIELRNTKDIDTRLEEIFNLHQNVNTVTLRE